MLYIGFDTHGPSVHLLKGIISACLEEGHHVRLIVRNRGGQDPDIPDEFLKNRNLSYDVIYDSPLEKGAFVKRYLEDIKYAYKCRNIYKKYDDIDVVFLQSNTTAYFALWLLKQTLNVPVLFNVQNIFPIDAGILNKLPTKGIKGIPWKLLRKMQQIAYQKSDCIVTISEDMRKTLIGEKILSNKIKVIYNWSYDDFPNDISDDENLFLRDHSELKNKFRVVFAGNFGAMVDPVIIAESADILREYEQIMFIIIGEGNNLNRLKQLAKDKNLPNISFFPYQPEEYARHNYAMAHVNINALPKGIIKTCMPSKTATMLNAARPMVVAVDLDSDYARILQGVDQCTVVDCGDSEEFARVIKKVYLNNYRLYSYNARIVFNNICSNNNANRYKDLLVTLANKRHGDF